MGGIEDGLILFTREARAVIVSPAAEKFLGAPPATFLGRRINEIFPAGHPLHAVAIHGDELNEDCGGNRFTDDRRSAPR